MKLFFVIKPFMQKCFLSICILMQVCGTCAQTSDTVKASERKVQWLVGVDALSDLNVVSLIGGLESNRSRYSTSLSYMLGSARIGAYYDYYISKKYRFFIGIGYLNSFRFNAFGPSRKEYTDSLIRTKQEVKASTISFLPDYGETRFQYLFSLGLTKEFKLYKGLILGLKAKGLYGYNPFYKHDECGYIVGAQLFYKW